MIACLLWSSAVYDFTMTLSKGSRKITKVTFVLLSGRKKKKKKSLDNNSETFTMSPCTSPLHAFFMNSKTDKSSCYILSIFFTVKLCVPLAVRELNTSMHFIKILLLK